MRWVAAVIGSLTAVATTASAAVPDPALSRQVLFNAAFSTPSSLSPSSVDFAAPGLSLGRDGQGESRLVPGVGLVRYSTSQVISFAGPAYIDSIRISSAGVDPRLGSMLLRPGFTADSGGQNLDLAYVRDWPQAFKLDAGRLTFDISPHAGLGLRAGGGRSAEAGALVRLQQKMLRAAGLNGWADQPGRLFLFAGATETAVGFSGPHVQAALGPDPDDVFISEAQAGIGFQRGAMQASLGFSHQSLRLDTLGDESRTDNRVALRVSIH
jgi:hypothetical protein